MRRLMRNEEGAVAIIVAILLVVLVGITAFVVDVGDAYWEQRMLQNAADAAALAVAIDCAEGDCLDFDSVARDYADDNNFRGANVASIVGPDGVNPPTPAGGEVTVTTRTGTRADPGFLQVWFAGVLGQDQGLATQAAATAIWGTIQIVDSHLPLTVSVCDWENYTGLGWEPTDAELSSLPTVEELPVGPYYGTTLKPEGQAPITLHDSDPEGSDECTTSPGFSTNDDEAKFPAGFGWLDGDKSTCSFEIRTEDGNQFADAKGGLGQVGKNCLPPSLGQAVVLPIFVDFYGNVGNGEYGILTPAAFYLTGYANVPGLPDTAGAAEACDNKSTSPYFADKKGNAPTCITGHFVQKVEAGGTVVVDPSGGVNTVQLSR